MPVNSQASVHGNCKSIAFTGGGTGGHIYPGLAVAASLGQKLPGSRLFWIGSTNSLDKTIVEEAGIPFYGIPAGKLRRNLSLRNLVDCFKVAAGFFAARRILRRERPALLFSKGGFVSVPPCAAAASLGIPVFTHESDWSPGLATRINARFAAASGGARGVGRIITAYGETAERFPRAIRDRVLVLGNPVRSEFRSAGAAEGRAFAGAAEGDRILLVLGGSQGAKELNLLVESVLGELTGRYFVVHQTGAGHRGPPPGERYRPVPYIRDEMPGVLASAELVLCRAGAGTVWECAAAGKPMILLPLAGRGTRGDQVENAAYFERAGAALVLGPGRRRPEDLAAAVDLLAGDPHRREALAAASKRIGAADASEGIARLLLEALNGGGRAAP
ncbi:MAG: undecaprenyldiphospho-muramoylpentapeptide beta-N-acetylglucosaminyltransferase [Treponema sp.]|jgi:UDP-N-acetylglucosamine--N-acetylmuramyl-(pentapeptide) pyrophosphoryl-undecaprenol N-acetylglucosamine transferase|nr:undecaprenyldiphospho-muramoylpentapeptide beta-N-acetylglucosaminyltransferase [Treponema sp.]